MKNQEEIKEMVRNTYSEIANQTIETNAKSCCGSGTVSQEVYNIMTDEYDHIEGYNPEADLKLGCGLPTEFAKIKEGDTVIDLGSGAGNDCFVARHATGTTGKVIGVDFTEAMINKARENAEKMHLNNVEFRLGDIENLPINDTIADVIVSNCVMNLVPDKQKAFSEVYRVLKNGGHFSISDIVVTDALPAKIKNAAEMYAGCVASAILKEDYLQIIKDAGFKNITIQAEKPIIVPDDILKNYLNKEEVKAYKAEETKIFSITVYAEKQENTSCC